MADNLLPPGFQLTRYDGSDGPAPNDEAWFYVRHLATNTRVVTRLRDIDAAIRNLQGIVGGTAELREVPSCKS